MTAQVYATITIQLREDGTSSLHTQTGWHRAPVDILNAASAAIEGERQALVNCPVHKAERKVRRRGAR